MRGPAAQLVLELLADQARPLWTLPDDPSDVGAWFPPQHAYPPRPIPTPNAAYDGLVTDIRRRREQAAGPRIRYWGYNWIEIIDSPTKAARVAEYTRKVGAADLFPDHAAIS